MTNVLNNVVAGRPKSTGGAYRAPIGSVLPTDSTTALDAAFKSLGYIGDAGVTETIGRTTTTVKAWGNDIVKVLQTDFAVTYQVTLIESLSESVAQAVNGDANVVATAATTTAGNKLAISVNSAELEHSEWAFDIADLETSMRLVLPNAQVLTVGDVTYNDGAVVAYPVTIQAFPDASGNSAYKYSDDGQKTA
ncbi:phage tail tube protein [Nocardioides terrisoli]|uniref:phage tail tube protein n=1 Tax=Nocardioides terrisoli TaxID=3388267 RepID=UPI00287BB296|nr:hypothetical protein [Nocardioides marmorisolisilvae]